MGRTTRGSHITYYSLVFFIAYAFEGQVHVFAGQVKLVSLVLQDKCNIEIELQHEIFNNVVCTTSKGSDQPAHTRSLIRAFASRLTSL